MAKKSGVGIDVLDSGRMVNKGEKGAAMFDAEVLT